MKTDNEEKQSTVFVYTRISTHDQSDRRQKLLNQLEILKQQIEQDLDDLSPETEPIFIIHKKRQA